MAHRKLIFEEIERRRLRREDAAHANRYPVIGILEDIRSLYNVGSCFRTADAMLLQELVLAGYTPAPPRREIAKTALGADLTVPWRSFSDARSAIEELRMGGWFVAGLEIADGALPIDQIDTNGKPIAFVAGNELTGVRPETLDACDAAIEIPMFGTKHSLNVAVAFGIAAWECIRRLDRASSGAGR